MFFFCASVNIKIFFFIFSKGDTVQVPEIRRCVNKYVKEYNLQDETNER